MARLQTMPAGLLVVATIWFVLCTPWLVAGQTVPYDSKTQFYPALYFASESLRSGDLPFWNPYVYGGYPAVSDPQSMIFSPLAMGLMRIVERPSIRWFDAIELLHLLTGGAGMLMFSRRMGWSPLAGCFAAVVYMFGGSASARLQHVPMIFAYGYFPIALTAVDKAIESRRFVWGVLAGILSGIMAAHQNQVAYLCCWVLVGYAAHRSWISESTVAFPRRRMPVLLAAAASALAVVAVPLYATLQFLPMSNRAHIGYDQAVAASSLHPSAFVSLFIRNFFNNAHPSRYWGTNDVTESLLYAGTFPIVVVACLALTGAFAERRFRYFSAAGIVAVLYALGSFTPLYFLLYHAVPGVNLFRRPADATFMLNIVLALATGLAVDQLLQGAAGRFAKWRVLVFGGLIAGVLSSAVIQAARAEKLSEQYLFRDVLLAALFLAVAAVLVGRMWRTVSPASRTRVAMIAFVLLVIDLAVHNAGSRLNAQPAESVALLDARTAPDDPAVKFLRSRHAAQELSYRVEFVDAGALWANAPMVLGIRATQGYNPLRYTLYERVAGAQEVSGPVRPFTPLLPAYDTALFDLLGVRYVVSNGPLPDPSGLIPVQDGLVKIWENRGALPLILGATRLYLVPETEDAGSDGVASVDYRNTVVLSKLPGALAGSVVPVRSVVELGGEGTPEMKLSEYRNTRIVVAARSTRAHILVLHELYYPFWKVYVDDLPVEMFQANYLFRGVYVPAGDHTVVFAFEPFAASALQQTVRAWIGQ